VTPLYAPVGLAPAAQTTGEVPRPTETREAPPHSVVDDMTGQRRMVGNVLAGWASYVVLVVAGFILPRFIDRHVGQAALGVWDFAWSIVSYFGLVQLGLGSTVNRFVAGLRANGNIEGLRRVVSTVTAMLLVAGVIVAGLTVFVAWTLPWLFAAKLGALTGEARGVVLLLGFGLAFQQATSGFNGVITGCHRWGLHNAVTSSFYAAQTAAMLAVLSLGGGLVGLACAATGGAVGAQVVRGLLAFRVCPELRVAPRYVSWEQARLLLSFGGKSLVPRVAELLMDQTTNLLVVAYLGPAALAIFSRPRGLMRHVTGIVSRYAFVLEPTTGSLCAIGDQAALRHLLVRTASIGAYIALPMSLMLGLLGDPIIEVWMGPHYRVGVVLLILVLGNFARVSQMPALSILLGMNAHGRPGLAQLAASAFAAGLAFLMLGPLAWGLVGAALAVTLPLAAVVGIYVPMRACRLLSVSFHEYLCAVWGRPLLAALPYALALALAHWRLPHPTLSTLAVGVAPAVAILMLTYWHLGIFSGKSRSGGAPVPAGAAKDPQIGA
jgi:O-antigen/teichoic acid export membrane protein